MPEDINGGYHLNSDDALKSSANILDARERDEQQQRLNNLGGGGGGSKGGSGMGGAGAFLGILLWIVKVIPKYLSIFCFSYLVIWVTKVLLAELSHHYLALSV